MKASCDFRGAIEKGSRRNGEADYGMSDALTSVRPPLPRVYSRQRGPYPGMRLGVYEVIAASAKAGWARCFARAIRSSIAMSR